jgi:hypothetical protein
MGFLDVRLFQVSMTALSTKRTDLSARVTSAVTVFAPRTSLRARGLGTEIWPWPRWIPLWGIQRTPQTFQVHGASMAADTVRRPPWIPDSSVFFLGGVALSVFLPCHARLYPGPERAAEAAVVATFVSSTFLLDYHVCFLGRQT